MQRKFDEHKEQFLKALSAQNWNDVVLHSTQLLHMDDSLASVWANRGLGLNWLGHPLDAILNIDRSLALEETALTLHNKGSIYWDMGDAERGMKWLRKAAEMDPTIPQTYFVMGNIHRHKGNLAKAITCYRQAIKIDPDYADGHMVLGMALLKNGDLKEGWKEYEWRWKTPQLPARKMRCPQWAGQDLTNKTILIYGEQGLGDITQFARYARSLANQFPRCKIIVEGRHQLKRLLSTIPEIYAVINCGDKLPDLDYAVPMLTLAGMLTPSINFIPSCNKEYLLNYNDVEAWGEKLLPLTSRQPEAFKVGICWAGMSRDSQPCAVSVDRLRSTSLDTFAPLAAIPGISWVSLQKGPPAEQVKKPPAGMLIGDFTEEMYDFYETACAIENCDLVISVDTAVLHVAASIGKPTWLLSRWDGCWRWFGDNRETSPWYPSLRQFVQPAPHDWDGMMKKVAEELADLVRNKNEPELNLTMAK